MSDRTDPPAAEPESGSVSLADPVAAPLALAQRPGGDILFLALTRPALKYGVPFEGLVLNATGSLIFAMLLGNPLYALASFILLHFPMRHLTAADYNFFRIHRLWLETKGRAVARHLWGGSSLAPLPTQPARAARDLPTSV